MGDSANTITASAERRLLVRLRDMLVLSLIVLLPFFSGSTHYLGQALSGILLCCLAFVAILSYWLLDRRSFSLSLFEILGLVILTVAVLSALQSIYAIDAWYAVGGFALIGIGYRVVRGAAEDRSFRRVLIAGLLVSGALQSAIAAHQYFFTTWYAEALPGYYSEFLAPNIRAGFLRAVGGFINPNYLAAYLNICFAVVLALVLFGSRRWTYRTGLAALGIVFIGVIGLTASKAGMAVTFVIATVLLAIKDRRLLIVILVLAIILLIVPNPLRDQYVRAITADPYLIMRVHIWNASLQIALDKPVLGVGPNNFHHVSHRYAPPTDQFLVRYSHVPRIAHNSYLHTFAELGVVGFITLLLIMAAVIVGIWRIILGRNRKQPEDAWLLGAGVGLVGVLLHSFVDNAANNRCLLLTCLFMFALIASRLAKDENIKWKLFERRFAVNLYFPRNATALISALILFVGFTVAIVYLPLNYETAVRSQSARLAAVTRELRNLQGSEISVAEKEFARALLVGECRSIADNLQRLSIDYPANEAVRRYLGSVNLEIFRRTNEIEAFTEAVANFAAADRNLPGRVSGVANQIDSYFDLARSGYPKTVEILALMESLAEKAIENWPTRATAYHLAAGIATEKGELEKAGDLLEKAVELEPNFLQAIVDLVGVAQAIADDELGLKAMQMYSDAVERIKAGPHPAADDEYARIILAPPMSINR